jgi:hypothetical protein
VCVWGGDNIVRGYTYLWWDDETGLHLLSAPRYLHLFICGCVVVFLSLQGKPAAIARIRQRNPYNTVVMIGDGITDLEAVQVSGRAGLGQGPTLCMCPEALCSAVLQLFGCCLPSCCSQTDCCTSQRPAQPWGATPPHLCVRGGLTCSKAQTPQPRCA